MDEFIKSFIAAFEANGVYFPKGYKMDKQVALEIFNAFKNSPNAYTWYRCTGGGDWPKGNNLQPFKVYKCDLRGV